jgi:hypothetical protein
VDASKTITPHDRIGYLLLGLEWLQSGPAPGRAQPEQTMLAFRLTAFAMALERIRTAISKLAGR